MIRVALADDHRVVIEGLRRYFESHPDIRVIGVAVSGEDALARLPDWQPQVLVLDLLMPGGIDGIETTRRALALLPDLRIVALTASVEESRMAAVLRAGATGYVRKDADPEVLLTAVRSAARGLPFIDPRVADAVRVEPLQENLTARELEVLRQVAFGRTNREAGEALFISEETVKTHVARILDKLDLQNRAQLVAHAIKRGLVRVDEL